MLKCGEELSDHTGLFNGYGDYVFTIPSFSLPFCGSLLVRGGMRGGGNDCIYSSRVGSNSFNPNQLVTFSLPLGSERTV